MRDLGKPREAEEEAKPARSPGRAILVPGCFETFPRNAFFSSISDDGHRHPQPPRTGGPGVRGPQTLAVTGGVALRDSRSGLSEPHLPALGRGGSGGLCHGVGKEARPRGMDGEPVHPSSPHPPPLSHAPPEGGRHAGPLGFQDAGTSSAASCLLVRRAREVTGERQPAGRSQGFTKHR